MLFRSKKEFALNGELVTRVVLPDDYVDLKRLRKLLGIEHITRGQLKKWCNDHHVPCQFSDLASMDKDFYIWEQVRLVTENKDVKGGLKRLRNLATRSTVPKIRALSQRLLNELTRFDNKA